MIANAAIANNLLITIIEIAFNKRPRFFDAISAKVEVTSMKAGEAIVAGGRDTIDVDVIAYFIIRTLFFRSRRSRVKSIVIRALHLFISF